MPSRPQGALVCVPSAYTTWSRATEATLGSAARGLASVLVSVAE